MITFEEKIRALYKVLDEIVEFDIDGLEQACRQLEGEIAAEHKHATDTPSAIDSRSILVNTTCS